MALGPSSSRLLKARPLFVKEIEVTDKGTERSSDLYGLSQTPELTSKGFYLWLSRGSKVPMRWEAQNTSFSHLQVASPESSCFLRWETLDGFFVIITFLIFKYFGACNGGNDEEEETRIQEFIAPERAERSETDPLLPEKPIGFTYGTGEEDLELGSPSSGSSDELYDGKICVICYDNPRNCFFAPCGHCATCYDCAQRIMDGENKVCPICRRLIRKVRKVFTS